MRLTMRDAAFISGINYETIRRHIFSGILYADNNMIDECDLYNYSIEQWERGRVLMYPPNQNGYLERLNYVSMTHKEK